MMLLNRLQTLSFLASMHMPSPRALCYLRTHWHLDKYVISSFPLLFKYISNSEYVSEIPPAQRVPQFDTVCDNLTTG